MNTHAACLALGLCIILGLTACQTSNHASPTSSASTADPAAHNRDHGYALLYSTLSDDSDVDKVLIIKRPAQPVADLIKSIGEFCRNARDNINNLAKEDPAISLANQGLPQPEVDTRAAISSDTSKKILFAGGKDLEFRLLLTQHEALNYISHTASAIAESEPRENRKRFLSQLSKDAAALHDRVIELLETPYTGVPKSK